jgi:hypothetical protein
MTDMVVHNTSINGWDIHTKDLKACSGYNGSSYPYQALKLVLIAWKRRVTGNWNERCYTEYSRGYSPVMPVFLAGWQDESD